MSRESLLGQLVSVSSGVSIAFCLAWAVKTALAPGPGRFAVLTPTSIRRAGRRALSVYDGLTSDGIEAHDRGALPWSRVAHHRSG